MRRFIILFFAFFSSVAFAECAVDTFLQNDVCVACPANSSSAGGSVISCTCDTGTTLDGAENGPSETLGTACRLIPEFGFSVEVADGGTFGFRISAAGTYYIDWGDDSEVEVIVKDNTNMVTYSHPYSTGGVYNVNMSGQATQYSSGSVAAISFSQNKMLTKIDGSLGKIFGTLSDGSNPIFYQTFYMCTALKSEIPQNLFDGISGNAPDWMFRSTFEGCTQIYGQIPDGLFGDINVNGVKYCFFNTFYKCSGLTGTIPADLFSGASGDLVSNMFVGTFRSCSGLTGYVPYDLFENINTASFKSGLMKNIFADTGLDTSCPANMYKYTTGFEADFSGVVACAPCPDGGQSPAGSTSIDACTGGTVVCGVGQYKNQNDVCVNCPDDTPNSVAGATDVQMCFSGQYKDLHVADNIVIGLIETKRTSPALHVQIGDTVYYEALTTTDVPAGINSNQRMKILYNNSVWYVYDQIRQVL